MKRKIDEMHLAQGEKNEYGRRVYRKGGSILDRLRYWWNKRKLERASYYFFGRKTVGNPLRSVEHSINQSLRTMRMQMKMFAEFSCSDDEDHKELARKAYKRHENIARKLDDLIYKLFNRYVDLFDIDIGREEIEL